MRCSGYIPVLALPLAMVLALGGAGCRKRATAAPPATPLPSAEKAPPPEMKPPEVGGSPKTETPVLVVPPAKPPKPPKKSAPPTPPEPEAAATEPVSPKPEPPRISPRYSPQQQAEFRRKANEAIAVAERNLQAMSGRTLSATQIDLSEKVRGFLGQAREAMQAGDWFRAENLASKARVLSEELVASR
jgi:outer membrane biosynthesis protein TonB